METPSYFCLHCDAVLNPAGDVILRADLGDRRALVLLSSRPGDYRVTVPPGFALRPGDRVRFACPVCGHAVGSAAGEALAEIGFRAGAENGTVLFSEVYGRHATWVVSGAEVRAFGEHAEPGVNFWGVGRPRTG